MGRGLDGFLLIPVLWAARAVLKDRERSWSLTCFRWL